MVEKEKEKDNEPDSEKINRAPGCKFCLSTSQYYAEIGI